MKSDYLKELGHLGMIARLKRLSDNMLYSIRDVYKIKDIDIEPNWHFVFLILKKYKRRTISEMAEAFQLSQPAVVKIINKMKKKGYIDIALDDHDSRKRQLQLSKKALDLLPDYEAIWSAGQTSIQQMLQHNGSFFGDLETLEQQLRSRSFSERILTNLKQIEK